MITYVSSTTTYLTSTSSSFTTWSSPNGSTTAELAGADGGSSGASSSAARSSTSSQPRHASSEQQKTILMKPVTNIMTTLGLSCREHILQYLKNNQGEPLGLADTRQQRPRTRTQLAHGSSPVGVAGTYLKQLIASVLKSSWKIGGSHGWNIEKQNKRWCCSYAAVAPGFNGGSQDQPDQTKISRNGSRSNSRRIQERVTPSPRGIWQKAFRECSACSRFVA